jgi:hypothetical protein
VTTRSRRALAAFAPAAAGQGKGPSVCSTVVPGEFVVPAAMEGQDGVNNPGNARSGEPFVPVFLGCNPNRAF